MRARKRFSSAGLSLVAAVVALSAVPGCGGDGPAPAHAPDGGAGLIPVGVETVAPETVRAGQTLHVTCLLLDEAGESFEAPAESTPSLRFVPEDSVERQSDGTFVAVRTGAVEVACRFASLGLLDDTPAVIDVLPGAPALAVTRIEPGAIVAGDSAEASCEVYDRYGNPIADATPAVRAHPADAANAFEGTTGTFQRAGRFDVRCELDGVESRDAELEVRPGLPASLLISRVPDQPIYGVGQVITIERLVADRFGNPIADAVVPVSSEPAGQQLGEARFRYLSDGRYTLTATVRPPTEGAIPLSAETEVIVDGNGPAIGCEEPLDGAILDLAPGGSIDFRGSVSDLTGVTEMRVNGAVVPVGPEGTFVAPIAARYGINFVDLAAIDGNGREASRTCAFLVASVWAPDDRTIGDVLSLAMRQPAFDDGNRAGGLDSFADVLATVLNSSGLRDSLHTTLLDANPLKPSSCDQSGPFGSCLLRSRVDHRDLRINGPNSVQLTLVNGGLRANVGIQNLRVNVRVSGTAFGIDFDTTGWVTFNSADVAATFDASLAGGRPRVTVRPGSVSVSMGSIDTEFSGLDGAIINIVASLFNGTVRNMVSNLVRDWVVDNFDGVLDGVLGGLDVASLGTSFDVPRLDGGAPIPLSFGVDFSSLGTTSTRMLFGIGTRFTAPPAHARPTLGAPVRSGARLRDPSGAAVTAVAVHEALLTQALHALWRGGFFDATLGEGALGGLPEGVSATMQTGLPPVLELRSDGRGVLSLGAITMDLSYPDLFAEPIAITLGARASMAVALAGEDLSFSDFRIEELFFSTGLVSLDAATRDTIERFLGRLLERVVSSALEDALPAIPIPSFELPASLATYGLPAGARLGIVSPNLATEPPHLVLRGAFAVQ